MNTNLFRFSIAMALTAIGLRGQAPDAPPPSSTPPASVPLYGSGYQYGFTGPVAAGAITIPYATKWDSSGVIGELGGLWSNGNFLGGEISYYGGDGTRYDVFNNSGSYIGHFDSYQNITTLDLAYRFFAPLWRVGSEVPVSFYVGASGGVAFVNYTGNIGAFGFHNDNDGNWTGEGVAGLQFSPYRNIAFRVGYRYVTVNDAWVLDRKENLDSSVVEAGLAIRF